MTPTMQKVNLPADFCTPNGITMLGYTPVTAALCYQSQSAAGIDSPP